MRLNKARANRCGKCDYLWHTCIDKTFVPPSMSGGQARQASNRHRSYNDWHQEEDGRSSRKSSASPRTPRGQKPKTTKKKNKQKQKDDVPALDPPWNPSMDNSSGGAASSDPQTENKFYQLMLAVEKQENSAEVQQIIDENLPKHASSKQMHSAVSRLDQARNKFQTAQKARTNLQKSWSKYLDASVKRWKTFAEKFGKQDADLEAKVVHAKEKLQEARQQLDEIKERLSKRDEEALQDAMIISDTEEEGMKVETSEKIVAGINTMLETLDSVRMQISSDDEDGHTSKKQRTEGGEPASAGGSTAGKRALRPFAKAGK